MEETMTHWTKRSTADFVYSVSSNFVAQLEVKMEREHITKKDIAGTLGVSASRVSQIFNNPGNLEMNSLVEYAGAIGMKISVIAYDDHDPHNDKGPINPEVFVKSWERLGRPQNMFDIEEAAIAETEGIDFYAETTPQPNREAWRNVVPAISEHLPRMQNHLIDGIISSPYAQNSVAGLYPLYTTNLPRVAKTENQVIRHKECA